MIRLGLRLTLGSGREAALRLLVVAAAVALGVGVLLFALAGVNGLHAQTDRGAWLDTPRQTAPAAAVRARARRPRALRRPANCGGCPVSISSAARRSTGSTSPPPDRVHRSRRDSPICLDRGGTTHRPHSPSSWRPGRRTSFVTGSLVIRSGRSAQPPFPPPTRSSSSSATRVSQLSKAPGAIEIRSIQRSPANCYKCQSGTGSGPVLESIVAGGAVASCCRC